MVEAYVAAFVFAGIHGVLYFIGLALFLWKIRSPIIQNRGFTLAIVQTTYSVIHFAIIAYRYIPGTSCVTSYISTALFVPLYMFVRGPKSPFSFFFLIWKPLRFSETMWFY